MCGIFGLLSNNSDVINQIYNSLEKLEYRGYDSCGVAYFDEENNIQRSRTVGNVSNLKEVIDINLSLNKSCNVGIGHTRWATHGSPTVNNAHPHISLDGKVCIVHNGIIENYKDLKKEIDLNLDNDEGYTDTEVLANYLSYHWNDLNRALFKLKGTFGIVIMHSDYPEQLIVVRKGSPIIISKYENNFYVSSDCNAFPEYLKSVIYLEDNEIAFLSPGNINIFNFIQKENKNIQDVIIDRNDLNSSKGEYEHYMLKEIHEQADRVNDLLLGRINQNNINIGGLVGIDLSWIKNILVIGCGTSYNAGLTIKYIFDSKISDNIQVELASEFCCRKPKLIPNTLAIIISQSGETADVIESVKYLKINHVKCFGLINVVGSTLSRMVDYGLYLRCGPEISVASTKAFTNQIVAFELLLNYIYKFDVYTLYSDKVWGLNNTLVYSEYSKYITRIYSLSEVVKTLANKYYEHEHCLFMGRGSLYPIALEGALKLKEISYIHAEGLSASEMKHGPISLIDDKFFIIFLLGKGEHYDKSKNNLEQLKSRTSKIILITDLSDTLNIQDSIILPNFNEYLQPILFNIILQFFSYYISLLRKTNIDKPRHLAKSVTVL